MVKALVADIGGTNSRLELIDIDGSGAVQVITSNTSSTRAHNSLQACIQQFLLDTPPCELCVIGIAGIVTDHSHWNGNFSWPPVTQLELLSLGFKTAIILNDLEAAGHGITALESGQILNINPGKTEVPFAPKTVISAGTGLGMCFLTAHRDVYSVWPSEGGLADFGPKSDLAVEFANFVL